MFLKRSIPSEKNGNLVLGRDLFWQPFIQSKGFFQSGQYMNGLWKRALRKIPRQASIKRVLLLGYGAGGTNHLICRRFPQARITAIEWDVAMIELAKKLSLHRPNELTELKIGDAKQVVQDLTETYDLILFDLFHGEEPSPLLVDTAFLSDLQRVLHPSGYFLVNAFQKYEAIKTISNHFSKRLTWRYQWNYCALFRPFGCGGQGDPLLPGFLPFHADADFIQREVEAQAGQTFLQGDGYAGRRWHVGPLGFEMYYGDTEPIIEPNKGLRVIYWQTLTRLDVPNGWFRSPTMPNFRKTGYAPAGSIDNYWKNWDSHAQRHRKKWLTKPDAVIKNVDLETFIAAYRHGTVDWMLKKMFLWMLRRKAEAHKDLLHYWLAIDDRGIAIAGLATIELPDIKSSLHLIAFYRAEARHSAANYGLIDHWFRDSIAKGFTYLDFDVFRGPTDPKKWEGFTRFKGQFGTRFILYPNPLMRFVR